MIREFLQIKKSYFYIIIVVITLVISLFQRDELYNVVMMNAEPDALNDIKKFFAKTLWIAIPLVPLIILIRITYTATCLALGRFFSFKNQALKFEPYFNIALKGELIWAAFMVVNYLTFTASLSPEMPFTSQYLTLAGFLDITDADPMLMVVCSSLSIMELLYVLFMSGLYSVNFKKTYADSLAFVCKSYSLGLLFYIVILMFITLFLPH